jgi:hypothetical protein
VGKILKERGGKKLYIYIERERERKRERRKQKGMYIL